MFINGLTAFPSIVRRKINDCWKPVKRLRSRVWRPVHVKALKDMKSASVKDTKFEPFAT